MMKEELITIGSIGGMFASAWLSVFLAHNVHSVLFAMFPIGVLISGIIGLKLLDNVEERI